MMKACHFYLAFNPLFNGSPKGRSQAHEFHDLLKQKKSEGHHSLYWGKLKVTQYTEDLNVKVFKEVVLDNAIHGHHTHLFITDYHHMWVGKVEEVTEERPSSSETLAFYEGKSVEIWFKVSDFDLLSNDAQVTSNFIREMYVDNPFYTHKLPELTPFSSGIRFPMIVQNKEEKHFFRNLSTPKVLVPNELLLNNGLGMDIRNISQSFVIPQDKFQKFPEVIRTQITYAEILLVEATAGARKDRAKLEEAIMTYLNCLETLLNMTVINHLRREEGHRLFVTKDAPYKLLRFPLDRDKKNLVRLRDFKENIDLSQIKTILDIPGFFENVSLDYVFRNRRRFWEYCRIELRHTIKNEALIEVKTQLQKGHKLQAHDRELILVRNILLGIVGKGIFSQIVEHYYADEELTQKAS